MPIHDLSILTPMIRSSQPKIIKFNAKQAKAFENIKTIVNSTGHLMHPDISKPFHVWTDASKCGLGGMLAQVDETGTMRPVAYCSKVFNPTQTNWHVSEQELHAVTRIF